MIKNDIINSNGTVNYDNILKKFNQIVNVQDFGAVGDGITDDYLPFLNAYNATPSGGKIVVPLGKYYLSENPDDLSKQIEWSMDNGCTFIGAGVGNPSQFAGTFISPITNPGNIISGRKSRNNLNNIESPIGNGCIVNCDELTETDNSDFISVTGSIASGSDTLYLNSVEGINKGYGVLLISPTDSQWPDGTNRLTTMRVVTVDSVTNSIKIGPENGMGGGGAIATPWTGASITNGTFIIRKRAWNVLNFWGVDTSQNNNIDRYSWGMNGVVNINGSGATAIELELNLLSNSNDISRAIYIAGRGNAAVNSVAIDIQRSVGQNWKWGVSVKNSAIGILINADQALSIETEFNDAYSDTTNTINNGIIFENVNTAIKGVHALFAGKQLMNNATCIALQRFTDTNPSGAFLSFFNSAVTQELFRVSYDGSITTNGIQINQNMIADTSLAVAGYITIKDASGNDLKVMIAR